MAHRAEHSATADTNVMQMRSDCLCVQQRKRWRCLSFSFVKRCVCFFIEMGRWGGLGGTWWHPKCVWLNFSLKCEILTCFRVWRVMKRRGRRFTDRAAGVADHLRVRRVFGSAHELFVHSTERQLRQTRRKKKMFTLHFVIYFGKCCVCVCV